MRILTSGLLVLTLVTAWMVTSSAKAVVYRVDRSFTDGISTATLTGTVELPLGHYVIQNTAPNPFTSVDLTMTVNATSFHLANAITHLIDGTGRFIIDATPTTLTFDTANGNVTNPADLAFADNTSPFSNNRYAIGSNGDPAFEAAITGAGIVVGDMSFPNVFGTAVPEPSSIVLLGLTTLGFGLTRHR
jgi:PEP-CTERM motif